MKEIIYFSHDVDAHDDPKCVLLTAELGLEGYGAYWLLLEMLYTQEEGKMLIRTAKALAKRYGTSEEVFDRLLGDYDLFEVEGDEFYSPSMVRRKNEIRQKREQFAEWGRQSGQVRKAKKEAAKNLKDEQGTFEGGSSHPQGSLEGGTNNKIKRKEKENKIKDNNLTDTSICMSDETPDPSPASTQKPDKFSLDYLISVAEYYNRKVDEAGSMMPKVARPDRLSEDRKAQLHARLKEYGEKDVYAVIDKAVSCGFLNGDNNRGWRADFGWLMRKGNFPKVLEGYYDQKVKPQNKNEYGKQQISIRESAARYVAENW